MNSKRSSTPPLAIHLAAVTHGYTEGARRRVILQDADLSVPSGAAVVLLGRSGTGKSTLLNIIAGILTPEAGRVVVEGVDLVGRSERERTFFRRQHLGFVFQSYNLVPTLTVEENVALRLEMIGQRGAPARRRTRDLLSELGLADRLDALPDRLSGGEQQRVAVAAALIHEPRVVLADEPTGNLDLANALKVVEMLDRMTRGAGRTLVMATHSREVMGFADRIITVNEGRIVDQELPQPVRPRAEAP